MVMKFHDLENFYQFCKIFDLSSALDCRVESIKVKDMGTLQVVSFRSDTFEDITKNVTNLLVRLIFPRHTRQQIPSRQDYHSLLPLTADMMYFKHRS